MSFENNSLNPQYAAPSESLEEKLRRAEEKNRNLEARLETLLQFFRSIAHDIRGPVGNLEQLCEIITELSTDEELEEYVSLLPPTISSMQTAIKDLAIVMDIQNRSSISFQDCLTEPVMEKVKLRLQPDLEKRNAAIIADFKEEAIWYPERYVEDILYQFSRYLICNTVSTIAPKVLISSGREGNRIFLRAESSEAVLHSEKGIDLFKYQKPASPENSVLENGLFFVKNQVESLGGWISVVVLPPKSVRFTAYL